jgi:lactocepin
MKDLDFDELDRAVNTLMGSVPATDKSDSEGIKTVSIAPTLPPDATPADVSTPPASPPSVAPTPTPASPAPTPLAAKRGGRFMDVVHSSSDMKKDKPAIAPISRQGTTIEPTKPAVMPDVPKPTPTPASPVEPKSTELTPEEPSAPSITAPAPETSTTSPSDWPDPLEMSGFGKTESTEPVKSEEKTEMSEPVPLLEEGSETPVTAPESEDLQPLSSPFLTDAKVEKRPLGGAPTSPEEDTREPDHTPVVVNPDTEGTVDDPKDQLPPSVEESKKELPPEYQGDLVAIESGSTEAPAPAKEEAEEKKPEISKPEDHPAALLEAKTEDEPAVTGPTSIAQQYKEEPSTGDQHNGAIYDTEAYHKPLAHPAKKKSGWLVVIWILVILVVGAGAGVGLYFLGIF